MVRVSVRRPFRPAFTPTPRSDLTVGRIRWSVDLGGRTVAGVWDEVLAECVATLERRAVDDTIRLSRRHRWKPLAVDIDGDLGAVAVATRGKRSGQGIWWVVGRRSGGTWTVEPAGGGGHDGDPTLEERPAGPEAPVWRFRNAGGVGVRYALVQVRDDVVEAAWRGRRHRVAEHGLVAVVWRGSGRGPSLVFHDDVGSILGSCRPPAQGSTRLPWRVALGSLRHGRRSLRRRESPGGWFRYG